jgi:hypothetical protein
MSQIDKRRNESARDLFFRLLGEISFVSLGVVLILQIICHYSDSANMEKITRIDFCYSQLQLKNPETTFEKAESVCGKVKP